MKKILILTMTAVLLCASVFALSSCKKNSDDEGGVHTHTMGEWKVESTVTCTTDGKDVRRCTGEGCNFTETRTTPKFGHTLKTVEGQAPTCVEAGFDSYQRCTVCVYNTYEEIPATGHNYEIDAELNPDGDTCVVCNQQHICYEYEDWQITQEPDCTTLGKQTCKCAVCNATKTQSIPKDDHVFDENDKCTECGDIKSDITDMPDHEF